MFTAKDVETIYEVPLIFHSEGLDSNIVEKLGMWTKSPDLVAWQNLVESIKNPKDEVSIAVVGKYVQLTDSYKSLNEALIHAGIAHNTNVKLNFIDSEEFESKDAAELLKGNQGLLVPGGFGERGIEGMIQAISYARKNDLPFFGICLGMQTACIEFARNVVGWEDANSTEFSEKSNHPVIALMDEQKDVKNKGATMRLGKYPCKVVEDTLAHKVYGEDNISERHRHRFEFNNAYIDDFEKSGLRFSGWYSERNLVEMVELPKHPWFLGCQFHPEFKSKPMKPHPLFYNFIAASIKHKGA